MKRLNLGIIGAGPIVEKKHLPALAEVPEIAVLAICRRDQQKLHQLADRFRIGKRYTDYHDLLAEEDIEAVLIATGPDAQPEIVAEAARARKHLLVEKPMAETSSRAREMADAVRVAGVHFQVGFNKRFSYGYRQAKKLIESGNLGSLSGIQVRFWYQAGRRDPLLHNGIHFLDLVSFFMGTARDVFARSCKLPAEGAQSLAPETISVSIGFESGAVGNVLLSSLASWDYMNEHVDIVGSNHDVLSIDNGCQLRLFHKGQEQPAEVYENTLSVHWWSGNDEQGFSPQFRAFARTILAGGETPSGPDDLCPMRAQAEDGIRSLQLMEAVKKSLAGNVSVPISPSL